MPLLGQAALAMWWDMDPAVRADFEDWHAHEHFPERLAIPGFRRGTRWRGAAGGDGVFVMYEMESHETLSSAPYLARLNAPSPWSTRMMPHHRNMVRSQCRVLETRWRRRRSPCPDAAPLAGRRARRRGAGGFRARIGELDHAPRRGRRAPAAARAAADRRHHGAEDTGRGNQVADWVFVAAGYDAAVVEELAQGELGEIALVALGAARIVHGFFQLSYSATPMDVA